MCGRFFINTSINDLIEHYHRSISFTNPTGEIFPSDKALIVNNDGFKIMTWGFPFGKKLNINARSESIFEKPLYSKAIHSRRCLIPASLFFEWHNNIKYEIKVINSDIFSLAGFYSYFYDQNKNQVERFVIITTEANADMEEIHPRMPLIIHKDFEDIYLNPNIGMDRIKNLLVPDNRIKFNVTPVDGFEQLVLFK